MNTLFLILTGINALIFIFAFSKDIIFVIQHENFKKMFNKGSQYAKKSNKI